MMRSACRTRLGLAWGLVAGALLSTNAQAQVAWDDLEPGRWAVVSQNTIDDVDPCPNQDCSYSAVEGVSGVIDDWCGGAFASGFGPLGGLAVWGGGHNGYFGSEIYVFDLDTQLWVRHTEPYDDGSSSVAPACSADGIYPDGSACPAHTYDRVDYHPATNSFVILSGTPDPVCGGCDDNRAHLFSFTTNSWTLGASRSGGGPVTGATSAYDAARDVFWFLPTYSQAFSQYDPNADQWHEFGDAQVLEIDGAGVVDPIRDLYLFLDARGTERLYAIPLDAPNSGLIELSTTGNTEIQGQSQLGLEWEPISERFVAWDDGADVYVLTPPEGDWRTEDWLWARVPPEADNTVVPERGMNGTYSRFRYAPSVNAFVVVSAVDSPVWAYRLSPGSGTGPTPPPDGGAGGTTGTGGGGAVDGTPTTSDDGDCGCQLIGGRRPAPTGAMGLLLVALCWATRRRPS